MCTSRPFPGFERLYWVKQSFSTFRGELGVEHDRDMPLSLTRGETTPPAPIPIYYAMGPTIPSDVIWTTSTYPLIIHRRVIDLLLDNRLTGWGTYPVEVYGKQGEFCPDYVGFSVVGRCGPLDGGRSVEIMRQMPGGLFPGWRGIYFNEASWDGSDFFTTTDWLGFDFVTEDVVKVFKRARIKGVEFEPLDSVELGSRPGPVGGG